MANETSRDMTFDNVKHKIMQTIYKKQMFMATIKIGTKTSNRINIKFMTITQTSTPPSRNIRENEEKSQCVLLTSFSTDGYDGMRYVLDEWLDCITIKNSKWPKKYYEHYTSDHVFIDVDAPFM